MDERELLSELHFLEDELGKAMGRVAPRVADEEVRAGVEAIAQDHTRQAEEAAHALGDIGCTECTPRPEFRSHVAALEREVLHATDQDGLFNALAGAEKLDVMLHEQMIAEGFPAPVQQVIEQQTELERDHLDYLENRAPGITPTIHGVETVPKRGTVE
jgi:hypothetical protein